MLEAVVVETWKHVKIRVTQSFNAGITTTIVEMVVAFNINVVRRGILIGFVAKLGNRSNGVSARRNQSSMLLTTTTGVVCIPQMVFTNPITTTHGNMTTDQPLMNSMTVRGCRSADVMHSRGRYQEPIALIAPILDHRDGHYVRPNKVAFKYLDFKKDVDPYVHVRMFNSIIKTNAETSKEYVINAFSYKLRDTSLTTAIITCQDFLIVLFQNLLKNFANVIERFKMTSKYTWS
jgi:hypothetical protein